MAPKGSKTTKASKERSRVPEELLSIVVEKFGEELAQQEEGPDSTIKTAETITALEGALQEHAKGNIVIGAAFLAKLVAKFDTEDEDICSTLDATLFSLLVRTLTAAESCDEVERGLWKLLTSLHHESLEQSIRREFETRLVEIGRLCIDKLLGYLVNPENDDGVRRWAGIMCRLMLNKSAKLRGRLEIGSDELRQQIGPRVIEEHNEIIRLICGRLIKDLVQSKIPLQALFPQDYNKKLYDGFPKSTHDDDSWQQTFQKYVDEVVRATEQESENAWLFFGSGLRLEPSHAFGIMEKNVNVQILEQTICFLAPASVNKLEQTLDMPIAAIRKITIHENAHSQKQKFSRVRIELNEGDDNILYLDTEPTNIMTITITFPDNTIVDLKNYFSSDFPKIIIENGIVTDMSQEQEDESPSSSLPASLSQQHSEFRNSQVLRHGISQEAIELDGSEFGAGLPRSDNVHQEQRSELSRNDVEDPLDNQVDHSTQEQPRAIVPPVVKLALPLKRHGVKPKSKAPITTSQRKSNTIDASQFATKPPNPLSKSLVDSPTSTIVVSPKNGVSGNQGSKAAVNKPYHSTTTKSNPKVGDRLPKDSTLASIQAQRVTKGASQDMRHQNMTSKDTLQAVNSNQPVLESDDASTPEVAATRPLRSMINGARSEVSRSQKLKDDLIAAGSPKAKRYSLPKKSESQSSDDIYGLPPEDKAKPITKPSKKTVNASVTTTSKTKLRQSTGTAVDKPKKQTADEKKKRQSAPSVIPTSTAPLRQSKRAAAAVAANRIRGAESSENELEDPDEVAQSLPAKASKQKEKGPLVHRESESQPTNGAKPLKPLAKPKKVYGKSRAIDKAGLPSRDPSPDKAKQPPKKPRMKEMSGLSESPAAIASKKTTKPPNVKSISQDNSTQSDIIETKSADSEIVAPREEASEAPVGESQDQDTPIQSKMVVREIVAETTVTKSQQNEVHNQPVLGQQVDSLSATNGLSKMSTADKGKDFTQDIVTEIGRNHSDMPQTRVSLVDDGLDQGREQETEGYVDRRSSPTVTVKAGIKPTSQPNMQVAAIQTAQNTTSLATSTTHLAEKLSSLLEEDDENELMQEMQTSPSVMQNLTSTSTLPPAMPPTEIDQTVPKVSTPVRPEAIKSTISKVLTVHVETPSVHHYDDNYDVQELPNNSAPIAMTASQPKKRKSGEKETLSPRKRQSTGKSSSPGSPPPRRSPRLAERRLRQSTSNTSMGISKPTESPPKPKTPTRNSSTRPISKPVLLVDDHLIRKQQVISFGVNGPLNQGLIGSHRRTTKESSQLPPVPPKGISPELKRKWEENASLKGIDGTPRPLKKRPIISMEDHVAQDHIPSSPPVLNTSSRLKPKRHSSQLSRVDMNGSPIASPAIPFVDRMGKLEMQLSTQSAPAELQAAPLENTPEHFEHSDVFGPKISLGSQRKARPSSPGDTTERYVAHKKTATGRYETIGTHEVIAESVTLVDPFGEHQKKATKFTSRLQSGSAGVQTGELVRESDLPVLLSRRLLKPKDTLHDENKSHQNGKPKVQITIHSDTSVESSESIHSVATPLQERGAANKALNVAIRPHYTHLRDAIHRIADEVVIQLADQEDKLELLVENYDKTGTKLLDDFDSNRAKERSNIDRKLHTKSEGILKMYKDSGDRIEEISFTSQQPSIGSLEKEWRKKQATAQKIISDGLNATEE